MASGLSLRTGISAGGSYTPMTPASAMSSTAPSTVGQAAYGISGTGDNTQRKVAAYGSVGTGLAAMIALVYLWWSLPR